MLFADPEGKKVYKSGELLTPNIKLAYADLKCLDETQLYEKQGFLIFQGKCRSNNQIHHIRALNLNFPPAQENTNKVITIFLQETLRICSLYPDCILLDTLEFHENKICYAIKPITSPIKSNTSKLDVFCLLKQLITDIKYLSHHGGALNCVSSTNIYQIEKPPTSKDRDCLPVYFMQDWNQAIWAGATKNDVKTLETSTRINSTSEQDGVYGLALTILEMGGLNTSEIKSLLVNCGSNYEETLKSVLNNPKIVSLNLSLNIKRILTMMLDQDGKKRPSFEEILKILQTEEDNGQNREKDLKSDRKRTAITILEDVNMNDALMTRSAFTTMTIQKPSGGNNLKLSPLKISKEQKDQSSDEPQPLEKQSKERNIIDSKEELLQKMVKKINKDLEEIFGSPINNYESESLTYVDAKSLTEKIKNIL